MARSPAVLNIVRLLTLLRGRKRGMSLRAITEELACGRSSLYRYLETLEQGNMPLRRTKVNGEAWVALDDVAGNLTNEQLWAIAVARPLLRGLEGTHVVTALDRILATSSSMVPVGAQQTAPHQGDAANAVVEAIRRRRRLQVRYRGLRDGEARVREVEPVALHCAAGAWYVMAFDVGSDELKTFKLARFAEAAVLSEAIPPRDVDIEHVFAHSVAVWCGDRVDVVIELNGDGARLAHEYPLHPAQRIERVGDEHEHERVLVRATVAGLEEVTRWVLRWGSCAHVIEPAALRERIVRELSAARARYVGSSQPSGTAGQETRSMRPRS